MTLLSYNPLSRDSNELEEKLYTFPVLKDNKLSDEFLKVLYDNGLNKKDVNIEFSYITAYTNLNDYFNNINGIIEGNIEDILMDLEVYDEYVISSKTLKDGYENINIFNNLDELLNNKFFTEEDKVEYVGSNKDSIEEHLIREDYLGVYYYFKIVTSENTYTVIVNDNNYKKPFFETFLRSGRDDYKVNSTKSINLLKDMLYTYGYMDMYNIYKVEDGSVDLVNLFNNEVFKTGIRRGKGEVMLYPYGTYINYDGDRIDKLDFNRISINNLLLYTKLYRKNMFFKYPFINYSTFNYLLDNERNNDSINKILNNILHANVIEYVEVLNDSGTKLIKDENGNKVFKDIDYTLMNSIPENYEVGNNIIDIIEEEITGVDGYIGLPSVLIHQGFTYSPESPELPAGKEFHDEMVSILYNENVLIPLGLKLSESPDGNKGMYGQRPLVNTFLQEKLNDGEVIDMNTYVKFNTM